MHHTHTQTYTHADVSISAGASPYAAPYSIAQPARTRVLCLLPCTVPIAHPPWRAVDMPHAWRVCTWRPISMMQRPTLSVPPLSAAACGDHTHADVHPCSSQLVSTCAGMYLSMSNTRDTHSTAQYDGSEHQLSRSSAAAVVSAPFGPLVPARCVHSRPLPLDASIPWVCWLRGKVRCSVVVRVVRAGASIPSASTGTRTRVCSPVCSPVVPHRMMYVVYLHQCLLLGVSDNTQHTRHAQHRAHEQ